MKNSNINNTDNLQKIRKTNLKLIIEQFADGSVDKFSTKIGKHRTYVYALLKDMSDNNPRTITSKMSRFIEKTYELPPLSLDNPAYQNDILGLANADMVINTIPKLILVKDGDKFLLDTITQKQIHIDSKLIPTHINNHPVFIFETEDDLMAPKIEYPSNVFIEYAPLTTITDINNGAIYLITYCKKIRLVRLYAEAENKIRVKVDNPLRQNLLPETLIDGESFNKIIQIFGRAIGFITFNEEFS